MGHCVSKPEPERPFLKEWTELLAPYEIDVTRNILRKCIGTFGYTRGVQVTTFTGAWKPSQTWKKPIDPSFRTVPHVRLVLAKEPASLTSASSSAPSMQRGARPRMSSVRTGTRMRTRSTRPGGNGMRSNSRTGEQRVVRSEGQSDNDNRRVLLICQQKSAGRSLGTFYVCTNCGTYMRFIPNHTSIKH
eukprot:TRINITY_DN50155_c0_g2_i4.p1 TRINITY_DN50155_c0_g2~~TRINITY_DN50155_c0_g2_i4.p1  ORF type:complete len:189 (-),score=19.57 TRINITY_DN50155_c0_g2_i4:448-1014(-)